MCLRGELVVSPGFGFVCCGFGLCVGFRVGCVVLTILLMIWEFALVCGIAVGWYNTVLVKGFAYVAFVSVFGFGW